jgi:hypothetical protein
MAKVSRSMLKAVVKECLFEILLESTGETGESLVESRRATPKRKGSRARTSRPALDSISFNKEKPAQPELRPIDVSNITSDPIMASIFQDTASSTLLEQAAAERGKPGQTLGLGIPIDDNNNGDSASPLGEAAKNWAYLAFSDKSE